MTVRCWSKVKVGDAERWWGCQAVLVNGEWCYARPGSVAQDGGMCHMCADRLQEAQRKARVRIQKATAAKITKGYGPSDDAFR